MSVRISIVTACKDMADYVDETVSSVVRQGHEGLEYIVMDGGSTDGTLDVLRRHEASITHFSSGADEGQYPAIQKGFALATGDVMGWLNADDVLMPWALRTVARVFEEFPGVDWIIGLPAFLSPTSECVRVSQNAAAYPRAFLRNGWFRQGLFGFIQQESMFWRRSLWDRVGGLDLRWKWAADFDLWTRFAEHAELVPLTTPLAAFRFRGDAQRSRQGSGYADDVAERVKSLPRAPAAWRWLGKQGQIGIDLLRLGVWSKEPVIAYAQDHSLRLLRTTRQISRLDLQRLYLEWQVSRTVNLRRGAGRRGGDDSLQR